jgi:hypothetical protein
VSDVEPIYESHEPQFLRTLQELPFLVPSSCYYLNRYFGFEDKNLEKKPAFLEKHVPVMQTFLRSDNLKECLSQFE